MADRTLSSVRCGGDDRARHAVPRGLVTGHYDARRGGHLNNKGHAFYASFILECLSALESSTP